MSRPDRDRFSAKRKREAVLRLLRGEDLDLVSRELGVTAATLSRWRDATLEGVIGALRSRPADDRDERIRMLEQRLRRTVVKSELQREKIARLEAGLPLGRGRSRR